MTIKRIKTNDGIEHAIDYSALENKPVAVVLGHYEVLGDLENQASLEFDISSLLPDDGCNYLLSVQACGSELGSSSLSLWCTTDLFPTDPYTYLFVRKSNFGSTTEAVGGQCTILVGPGRKIYFRNNGSHTLSGLTIRIPHALKA